MIEFGVSEVMHAPEMTKNYATWDGSEFIGHHSLDTAKEWIKENPRNETIYLYQKGPSGSFDLTSTYPSNFTELIKEKQ